MVEEVVTSTGGVARSIAELLGIKPTQDQRGVRQIFSLRFGHENACISILSLPLIQEE